MTYKDALTRLQELYAKIPHIECQGLCGHGCGPIGMSALEWTLFSHNPLPPKGKGTSCPRLKHGRCTSYTDRPVVCRVWGVIPELPCPHGCVAESMLTSEESQDIIRAVEALSQEVFPGIFGKFTHTYKQIVAAQGEEAQRFVTERLVVLSPRERRVKESDKWCKEKSER